MLPILLSTALAADLTHGTVHRLDNGLTVIVEEQHRTDEVALFLGFGVGSRDERDGERGCAHLFEHLMFEGSAHVPNNAFDTWLTEAGGANNAWTNEDQTVYHMTFPSGALDRALFLESDRLAFLDAGLDAANLANQQEVVLQERETGYAEPHGRDLDALSRLLWPEGHPYHVPVIGTVDDVRGFTLDGVRSFWERHYRPDNATLVVVGHVDAEPTLGKITNWFSDVPPRLSMPLRATPVEPVAHTATGVLRDDVEDRTVYLGWPLPAAGHPDEPALELLSYVLDNGRGTRLDDALYYDRRLTTDLGAWTYVQDVAGVFVVSATSDRTPLPKLVAAVDKVLARVAKKPPTEAELLRARAAVEAALLDQLERPEDRAAAMLDCWHTFGDPNCTDDVLAKLAAVTPADVARVARTWLAADRRVSLSVVPEGDDGALPGAVPVELP